MMVGSMASPAALQATGFGVAATQLRTSTKPSLRPNSTSFLQTWSVTKLSNVLRSTHFHVKTSAIKEAKAAGVAFARSSGQMERSVNIKYEDDAFFTSEPYGEKQLKVSAKVTCNGTRRTFDHVLENLRRTAPPVQGFRKSKGGKSVMSKDVLYQMLGPSTVNSFVVEELVSSSLLEYVEKEGYKAKKEFQTLQSNKELAASFKAGEEFVFDAILSLEDKEAETASVEEDQNQ